MVGAGTIINPLIKVVTTVAILAAVYFFIVKPTLDTTNDAIDKSFNAFDETFDGFNALPTDIQGQINDAFEGSGISASSLEDCIQRAIDAGPDADQIQRRTNRCIDRLGD